MHIESNSIIQIFQKYAIFIKSNWLHLILFRFSNFNLRDISIGKCFEIINYAFAIKEKWYCLGNERTRAKDGDFNNCKEKSWDRRD